ncbi:BCP1 family, partial [Trinorchestia longiramus]
MSKKAKITEQMKALQEFADNSESEDEAIGEVVNVNFEGFTPQEDDFHGIQRLLAQTFRGLDVNISDVADLIIQQNFVGCVIKEVIDDDKEAMEVDDDALEGEPDTESDYVFGVNTILNISHKKKLETECIKSLRKGLLKRCQDSKCSDDVKQQFSAILDDSSQHVGFLINERLVNLPADIALPAFRTLLKEMEESNAIGMPFKFAHIILIAKTHKFQTLKSKKKLRKLKNEGGASGAQEDIEQDKKEFYDNTEEQSF